MVEDSEAETKTEGEINAHIQLCRVLGRALEFSLHLQLSSCLHLGSKLAESERLKRMSPNDALRIVSAFSKMRYRRDHVLSMLMTRLHRTEMLSRLPVQDLTSLVESLGLLRYKDERALVRVCAQLMQYRGRKPLTHSIESSCLAVDSLDQLWLTDVTVKLILGVVRLRYYDQQFISTLLLRLKHEELRMEHACSALHVLAKSGMRDVAFAQELLHTITHGTSL